MRVQKKTFMACFKKINFHQQISKLNVTLSWSVFTKLLTSHFQAWLWYIVVLIRLGIYLFVNKARGGGSPKFFIVMSQLHETKIP